MEERTPKLSPYRVDGVAVTPRQQSNAVEAHAERMIGYLSMLMSFQGTQLQESHYIR